MKRKSKHGNEEEEQQNGIIKDNNGIEILEDGNYSNESTLREALNYRKEKDKICEFIRQCKISLIIFRQN